MTARSRHSKTTIRWVRAGLVLTVVLTWLVQNSYLQTPIEIIKDFSIPFPCQFSGCGCSNAVQCWSSCGCHSDAEKIAWAKANGVLPPDWFLEDLKHKPAVCQTESSGGCCCCCSKNAEPASLPQQADTQRPPSTRVVYLVLKQQRRCQGLYDVDHVTWHFIPPTNQPLPTISITPLCEREPQSVPAIAPSPPTPPPRRV